MEYQHTHQAVAVEVPVLLEQQQVVALVVLEVSEQSVLFQEHQ
jgi:hypothetical protein